MNTSSLDANVQYKELMSQIASLLSSAAMIAAQATTILGGGTGADATVCRVEIAEPQGPTELELAIMEWENEGGAPAPAARGR